MHILTNKWAYYNEIDPFAAQWIRNLIKAGHVAPGEVDERSIEDVLPSDVRGFIQCHWFAGVAVWSHALRQAGWSDDRPVWTGSCPCQPFSAAGKGGGFTDERHLWPAFHHLIEQCRPPIVFGEQVASKAIEPWIDLVHTDLEALGYAFGCIAFPSSGVGAPHIRDRAYWVADSTGERRDGRQDPATPAGWTGAETGSAIVSSAKHGGADCNRPSPVNGFWRAADWLRCKDGKWRPIEPGLEPLVNGVAGRVGRLRAYGNAINAQAAQAFIESVMEVGCYKTNSTNPNNTNA